MSWLRKLAFVLALAATVTFVPGGCDFDIGDDDCDVFCFDDD